MREIERKHASLPTYPKTGTVNVADSTARLMQALKLDESQLQQIKRNKTGLNFNEFLTVIRNHKVLKENPSAERRAHIELIRDCQEKHRKDENGELILDEKKIGTAIHPLYDWYRFYTQY